jgi:hypothetical protein
VTRCDLAAPVLDCDATSVIGPPNRGFYVSGSAVYVWVTEFRGGTELTRRGTNSLLYRLPLGGSAPSALGVRGAPADQFSFRENPEHGVSEVLEQIPVNGICILRLGRSFHIRLG